MPSSTKQRLLKQLEEAAQPKPLDQQAIQLKLQEVATGIAKLESEVTLNNAKAQQAGAQAQAALMPEQGGQGPAPD